MNVKNLSTNLSPHQLNTFNFFIFLIILFLYFSENVTLYNVLQKKTFYLTFTLYKLGLLLGINMTLAAVRSETQLLKL